jgi:hypothetical protein
MQSIRTTNRDIGRKGQFRLTTERGNIYVWGISMHIEKHAHGAAYQKNNNQTNGFGTITVYNPLVWLFLFALLTTILTMIDYYYYY